MLLAPIRYGAGVKGKITDSFLYGLPVLTTSIGAEGIDPFPGFVADSKEELVAKAIRHYNDYTSLRNCQLWGWQLLRDKFSDSKNSHRLKASLTSLADTPLQLIMFGESLRSSYYFSKFLEAKQNLKE